MLKSIVNGAEHDIVSIPMKGKNLADTEKGGISSSNGSEVAYNATQSNIRSQYIPCDALAEYTISLTNYPCNNFAAFYSADKTYISRTNGIAVNTPRIISTPENAAFMRVTAYHTVDGQIHPFDDNVKIMLNAGSTALPYEPYGYQNGWEVRDNQNRLIWGREDELQTTTGTLPFKGYDLPIKVKSLLGNAAQNGTPSPVNVVIPEMCGVRTGNLINIYANDTSNGYVDNALIRKSGDIYSPSSSFISEYQPINENITYTLNTGGKTGDAQSICFYTSDKQFISGVAYESRTIITFTTPHGARYFRCTVMRIQSDTESYKHTMLNVGTESLQYEPYGHKITFENNGENLFDESNFDLIQVTETISRKGTNLGVLPQGTYTFNAVSTESPTPIYRTIKNGSTYTFETINSLPYTFTADGVSEQIIRTSGTQGNTWADVGYSNIMLNIGSTPLPYSPYLNKTIPIYLGEVPTIRRIKKLVLTGNENYSKQGTTSTLSLYSITVSQNAISRDKVICSHLPFSLSYSTEISISFYSDLRNLFLNFGLDVMNAQPSGNTVAGLKEYLAAQYAAGTPVTVWYVLENPQTGIVNEPLAKIGDYADELTTIKVNGLSAPLYGIGDYKDILNLATGVVTRNIKKLVLTGTSEDGNSNITPQGIIYITPNPTLKNIGNAYCTHFRYVNQGQGANMPINSVTTSGGAGTSFWFKTEYTNVGDFKSYLAAQYAAGTPVTLWYVLATPKTETVTVPTGMTGEIEGYLTQISTPTPEHQSIPKWNGKEETGGTYAVTVYNLPEIETTTGKNTLTVDTTIAPYDVTINGHVKYTYWGKIREDVRSGLAQTKFPVGTILYDNNDETTGRAFQVVGYDKHFDPSLTARGYNHSMTLCQLKLSGPWQFDATEAFLYTTVEMQPGTYKFKIPNYDTTYGGNKTYYFTSTVSVPVDSQITLSWAYQQLPKTVTAYAGPNPQTNTTAITGFNALPLSEWIEGESPEAIDLGTIKLANNDPDSVYGKLNHIHRARYGSNNYYQSGLRQLLNTDLASNNWWHPTTIFDRPYANRTTNGYLRSLNEDFINVLATPEITHIANNVFEYPSLDGRTFTLNTEYKINTDKVFLLSHTEVGLSASPNIGTVLDYYSTHNTNNDRIKYRIDNGNAYYWWFRTHYPAYAYIFRRCNTSGALYYSGAYDSLGVAPAHIIQ